MFKLFTKNKNVTFELVAPISGKLVDITEVPDPVFSQKMMGDGIAIQINEATVVAPCDGEVTLIPDSKHAFGMKNEQGMELLVHIGLETVALAGEGFKSLVDQGAHVAKGTPIIQLNKAFIESKGINLITPLVIINHDQFDLATMNLNNNVVAGETVVISYTKKQ